MTAPAHVLVYRPLMKLLEEQGAEIELTARDYAQTLQLLELHGLKAEVIGRHGGRSRLGKARSLSSRLGRLRRWAKGRELRPGAGTRLARADDHGQAPRHSQLHDVRLRVGLAPAPARLPGRHASGRARGDPARATRALRRPPTQAAALPRAQGGVLPVRTSSPTPPQRPLSASNSSRVLVVVRTPPDVSLYHRASNPLFPRVLEHLGNHPEVQAVVIPRTVEQRNYVRGLEYPSLIVPERAVDAQSLIALSDVVVSAGGTMNREAAALGVPVYTTYGGRLGGVDEWLIREGRLTPLTDPRAIELHKRKKGEDKRVRRDGKQMLELLLSALESRAGDS